MQQNDFIRISYVGKIKESGQEFDKGELVPVIVGANYVIPGMEDALKEMNLNEKKTFDVQPEKAFGGRDPKLVKIVPESEFKRHNTRPYPGMVLNADNAIGKVLSVSSGRVKVDFNHPLAGKVLTYEVEVKEKVDSKEDKINMIIDFFTKIGKDKAAIKIDGDTTEITLPPVVPGVIKKKISDDIIKYVGPKTVKFLEVFEKPKEEKKE